ncbi:hypothetical protein HY621_01165 [Candidatus Uhrbacteria bacterium]|nr:hypothetical protein [Candidatus Uhrbacteria bacterium]
MRYAIGCIIFLAFPAALFAEGEIQFTADRQVIYKKESSKISWDAPDAASCNSYVDVLDAHGKWVWQFSDTWQSANRPVKGEFEAKPADDARYYLDCTIGGQKVSKYVEVQVLDRDKYIRGEETPKVPVASSKPVVFQEIKKVSEPQKESSAKSGAGDSVPNPNNSAGNASNNTVTGGSYGGGGGGGGSAPASSAIGNKSATISENAENKPKNAENMDSASSTQKKIETKKEAQEGDTIKKKMEVEALKDRDSDFLSDEEELRIGTDPHNPDTDGDGYLDGLEVKNGYSPLVGVPKKQVKTPSKAPTVKKQPAKKTIQKEKVISKKSTLKKVKIPLKKAKKVLNIKKKTFRTTPQKVDKKTKRK